MERRTSECRGCGKPIIWGVAIGADGKEKKIPLDARAPTYVIRSVMGDGSFVLERADGDPRPGSFPVEHRQEAYVTHFATCSKANDFSGGRR